MPLNNTMLAMVYTTCPILFVKYNKTANESSEFTVNQSFDVVEVWNLSQEANKYFTPGPTPKV